LKAAEAADKDGFGADGWVLRGQSHEALGQRAEALKAYKAALNLEDKDSADVLEALVRLTIATGQRDEALGYLRGLVAVAANDPELLGSAAVGCARLGRFDEALELGGRAKGENGQMPEPARRAVGLAAAHRGEPAKAIELLNGPDPDAVVLLARIRARLMLGDLAGALADARAAKTVEEPTAELKAAAKHVQALVQRRDEVAKTTADDSMRTAADKFVCAEHFCTLGEVPDRVAALLGEALAGDAALGPAYGLRAVLAADRGRLSKALPDAEKAIKLAPSDFRGYLARGRVLLERGNHGGAKADLQKAVELSKHKDAPALHAYAAALALAGNRDEAIAAQREAVKLRPEVAEYQEQLFSDALQR
jgi:tetratricopeptide (TPR) repeat protein